MKINKGDKIKVKVEKLTGLWKGSFVERKDKIYEVVIQKIIVGDTGSGPIFSLALENTRGNYIGCFNKYDFKKMVEAAKGDDEVDSIDL